jgi:hypothetical protein
MDVTGTDNIGICHLLLPDISLFLLHSDFQGVTASMGLAAVRLLCMFLLSFTSQTTKRKLYAVKQELMYHDYISENIHIVTAYGFSYVPPV